MKSLKSSVTRGLSHGSVVETCDNSGAKKVKIISVINLKTTKRRKPTAGVGDLVMVAVIKGKPDMRKEVFYAVVTRQKQEFRRPDGTRVKFEDNTVAIFKDRKGNCKGTAIKGPIAKEATVRFPGVSKIASIIV